MCEQRRCILLVESCEERILHLFREILQFVHPLYLSRFLSSAMFSYPNVQGAKMLHFSARSEGCARIIILLLHCASDPTARQRNSSGRFSLSSSQTQPLYVPDVNWRHELVRGVR